MKLLMKNYIWNNLDEYLLSQPGILNVKINTNSKSFLNEIDITYDNSINPYIAYKYIELYENLDYFDVYGFDKETECEYKTLKYIKDDMCCEYCYDSLMEDLFNNDSIKSVYSNFIDKDSAFNVEFIIEYSEPLLESELLNILNEA